MNIENAKRIIEYTVGITEPLWKEFNEKWEDMGRIFLTRAYEQGGFENWKFIDLLDMYNINTIEKVGKILENYSGEKKYIHIWGL